MKKIIFMLAIFFAFAASSSFAQHDMGGMTDSGGRKNPALAALLSIQPLPVDIGNFYSGNWKRGILYTTAETIIFIPAMILLGRNSWNWGMHNNYPYYSNTNTPRSWTTEERNQFYYLLAGYIAVKIISAFDAGYSAEKYNQNLSLSYDAQINSAVLSLNIPLK